MYYPRIARSIIENRTYYCEYQPVVDAATGETFGYEALARFWCEEGDVKPDDLFLGLHAEPELIGILETALKRFQFRNAPSGKPLFINFDPRSAVSNPDVLGESGLPIDRDGGTVFEIVEDPFLLDDEDREALMSFFSSNHIRLAVDNFGRETKSFTLYLIERSEYVKFDRRFVRRCTKEPNWSAYAKAAAEFVHSLGKKVVFEGIENDADLKFALDHRADYVQGYLYKPRFIVAGRK